MIKKLTVLAILPFVILGFSTNVLAASSEEAEVACIEKADAQKVSDDKYDDFVAKCIEEAASKGKE